MRVKRFGEFIGERLFSGIIDRDASGDVRKEDILRPGSPDELYDIIDMEFRKQAGETVILNHIDVSGIKDMESMFYDRNDRNFDVSGWDVSSVTNFRDMFGKCGKFDCDLSGWKTTKAVKMEWMFAGCGSFTGKGLGKWEIDTVKYTRMMFDGCGRLDCDLSGWRPEAASDMSGMFRNCRKLDCDLSGWDEYFEEIWPNTDGMFDGCRSMGRLPDWYMDMRRFAEKMERERI